eukprot:4965875-Amphidinium_carterae.1
MGFSQFGDIDALSHLHGHNQRVSQLEVHESVSSLVVRRYDRRMPSVFHRDPSWVLATDQMTRCPRSGTLFESAAV